MKLISFIKKIFIYYSVNEKGRFDFFDRLKFLLVFFLATFFMAIMIYILGGK